MDFNIDDIVRITRQKISSEDVAHSNNNSRSLPLNYKSLYILIVF